MNSTETMVRHFIGALTLAISSGAMAQGVKTVDEPYLPVGAGVASPAASLPFAAAPIPKITFELRAADKSLKNAFLRWAEEQRQQVVWRLSGDIPLDANGPVAAVSLADAMTQAAAAFSDKQEPFVVREYDNAIVVIPRWAARP